jgi:hypothetical protein
MVIELLKECSLSGEISTPSHRAVTEALQVIRQQEYWQLQNQSKHAGKNATTDKQIAICWVALPALEAAEAAWLEDDFDGVIEQLTLAVTTEGETPKKTSKKGLVKSRAVR